MSQEVHEPDENAGASQPSSGPVSHLVIGRIAGPRGTKGELKVQILTDFPERFANLKEVFIGDELSPYEVQETHLAKKIAFLKLRGIDTFEDAAKMAGKFVHVSMEKAVPLAEGQYYWHEIIGLEVWTTTGQLLGRVVEILRTGANDVYVVRNEKEILIPAIEQVVKEIDPRKGRMVIEPMPGLI